MEKLNPRAVIFDLGSTLLEYETIPWPELGKICNESAQAFLQKQGYRVPGQEEFNNAFEKVKEVSRQQARDKYVEWSIPQVTRVLFNNLGIEYNDEFVDEFFNAYYEPVERELYIYDDVIDTLENIKVAKRVIGLVSNTIFPEKTHRQELKKFEIERYLNFTIFSSTFGLRKPHPDIFIKAANMAGFAPAECVYIGDRYLEDVQGPSGIGMPAILKCKENRVYPEDMPEDIRRITTLAELENHLDFE